MATRRPSKKQARSVPLQRTINLSEHDSFTIRLVNAEGKELANLEFDRLTEDRPQIKLNVLKASGDIASSLVVFDLNAPLI